MYLLNIQSSPRRSRSASIAVADAFLEAYRQVCPEIIVDTLNVWDEKLPEFDQESTRSRWTRPSKKFGIVSRSWLHALSERIAWCSACRCGTLPIPISSSS